jgi:signal transduction histidine kinase
MGPAHVNQLIQEIVSVVEHQFRLDNVAIELQLDKPIPRLSADADKLKQVFMNLLMNAKQAIGNEGRIEITTRYNSPNSEVLVSVADTGSGISPEIFDKIFDPFFTTKPTGQGTGLGLSVSYGIIKDHQGEIFAQSATGEGSVFTIRLPVDHARQEEA